MGGTLCLPLSVFIFLCICLIPFSSVTCLYPVSHMLSPGRAQHYLICSKHFWRRLASEQNAGSLGAVRRNFPELLGWGWASLPSTAQEEVRSHHEGLAGITWIVDSPLYLRDPSLHFNKMSWWWINSRAHYIKVWEATTSRKNMGNASS